jgi:hypothetical protein
MRKLQEVQQFFPRPLFDLFRFFLWDCAVAVNSHFLSQWWGLWCALQSLTSGWSCSMNRTIWNTMSAHIGTYCGQLLQVFTNTTPFLFHYLRIWCFWEANIIYKGVGPSLFRWHPCVPLIPSHSIMELYSVFFFPQLFSNLSAICSSSSLIHKDANANFYCIPPNVHVT